MTEITIVITVVSMVVITIVITVENGPPELSYRYHGHWLAHKTSVQQASVCVFLRLMTSSMTNLIIDREA